MIDNKNQKNLNVLYIMNHIFYNLLNHVLHLNVLFDKNHKQINYILNNNKNFLFFLFDLSHIYIFHLKVNVF